MQEIIKITKEDVLNNPSKIAEDIKTLAQQLQVSRKNLIEIENWDWWNKLTINKTKVFAELMLEQNKSMNAFVSILKSIIVCSAGNAACIKKIIDDLKEKGNNIDSISGNMNEQNNEFVEFATGYFEDVYESVLKSEQMEGKIVDIEEIVQETERLLQLSSKKDDEQDLQLAEQIQKDKEHDQLIRENIKKLEKQEDRDREHERLIAANIEKLVQQAEKDREHERLINQNMQELAKQAEKDVEHDILLAEGAQKNAEQDELFAELQKETERLSEKIAELQEEKTNKKMMYIVAGVSIVSLILNIVQFFI